MTDHTLNIADPAGVILNSVMWRLYVALHPEAAENEEITAELEEILSEAENAIRIYCEEYRW